MKKLVKSFSAIILSTVVIFTNNALIVEARTSEPIDMYLNDNEVKVENIGNSPFIKDGRTYLPIRTVGDLLGVDTTFNNNTKTVEIKNEEITAIFTVDSYEYYVNDIKYVSDVPTIIKSGTVYVPLRDAAEAFGANVYIDYETKNIILEFEDGKDGEIDEIDVEILAGIEKETLVLYIEIINSEEFYNFKTALFASDEFKEVLTQTLESETFELFLNDVLNSNEFKSLKELIVSLPSWQNFIIEVKELESYTALENKYGEDFLANIFEVATLNEVNLEDILGMLKDQELIDFILECFQLESYEVFKEDLEKVKQKNEYNEFKEMCLKSEYFGQLIKVFMENVNTSGLQEMMQKSPEGLAVIELVNKGTNEILNMFND